MFWLNKISLPLVYGEEEENQSETRITASILKQNPKHMKGSNEHYLLGQNKTCEFLG